MKIEYEATFANISKDEIRERLKKADAVLVRPEFLQKRYSLDPPDASNRKRGWIRVRDEGDKITVSHKTDHGEGIEKVTEHTINVDDFEGSKILLESIGCRTKSYQETKREVWNLDEVEICIDEWPYLEPFVEIEAENESLVRETSKKLGFDYKKAVFGPVSVLYSKKYNVPERIINKEMPKITFEGKNPFENLK